MGQRVRQSRTRRTSKARRDLDALHLTRTSIVTDRGAGTGYFSVRIARHISEGKVFAADIEPDMIRYIGERARREHLTNPIPVQTSADDANLPEAVDVVLVVDTYHHISNRTQYFAKLISSLQRKRVWLYAIKRASQPYRFRPKPASPHRGTEHLG
jgi:cyclopropane fatty-acyl-phospholipid synthase-like methyltransferase